MYFHIKEIETKCFMEEMPEGVLFTGVYEVTMLQNKAFVLMKSVGVHVNVWDPDEKLILSRLYGAKGKFVFTSDQPGDYKVCLSSNSTAWVANKMLRVKLDFRVGDHAIDYHDVASKEKLNDIQLRVRQLLDQVAMLSKDQDFQRVREEYFRRLSESTNNRVTWWSVAQVILLIFTGIFQMRNLRSFFLAKKLV